MMTRARLLQSGSALTLTAILHACGGNEPAPASPTNANPNEKSEHHEHHGDLPPPVHAFHETLAPLWHDKSPDRATKTCENAATLEQKANATNDKALISTTAALAAECQKDGRPDFEAKFKAVHERFHALAEKK
jgi:hypothetical protein